MNNISEEDLSYIEEALKQLKAENEKLRQQLKQQQYKKELNYGQGYKMYATEKGVIAE